jgi:hypothetical protein
LSEVFLISLCKWIASLAVGQRPPAKVEVKSVVGYKVDKSVDYQDLVSIAIKIEPTFLPTPDRLGLATIKGQPVDECAMGVQALKRVSKLVDIDRVLIDNPEILDEMIRMSTALLEEARYDISLYQDWLKST